MKIGGRTKITGIFGYPVEHTLSPPMHNAAYEALGLDYCYVPFLVHPECTKDVVALADFVGSTAQIIKYATESPEKKFIIGTEEGILHRLKKDSPDKKFYVVSREMVCPNMKRITLEKVLWALQDMVYADDVPQDVAIRARASIDRMLRYSG